MDREPHFIAPVLVMALALIVTGGIATGLVESADQARAAADQAGAPTIAGAPSASTTPTPVPTVNVTATANATGDAGTGGPAQSVPGRETSPSTAPRR
jgi:hypothetical protein